MKRPRIRENASAGSLSRHRFIAFRALLIMMAMAGAAAAQAPDPRKPLSQTRTQTWTDEHGLPSNSVQAVAQSADGYMWIATEEGLARFDGHQFTSFDRQSSPALPSGYVRALLPMADSSIWAGSEGAGLVHISHGQFTVIDRRSGLSSDMVATIAFARDGGIWVGTAGGGLNHVRGRSIRTYGRGNGLPHDHVNAVLEDPDGTVWIGTPAGLARLRGGRLTVHPEELPGRDVLALLRLRDGRIAVGTNGGVAFLRDGRLDPGAAVLPGVHVLSLLEDSRGTLWVGTHGSGVLRLVDDRHVSGFDPASDLGSGLIRSLHQDRTGALWIASVGAGIHRLKDPMVTVFGKPEGLPADVILAVRQGRAGAMHLGTAGGGMAKLSGGDITTTSTENGLSHNVVISIAEDRDGSLWLGTPRGLNRLSEGHVTTYGVDDGLAGLAILVTFIDSRGSLWLGTSGDGLQRWGPGPRRTFRRADGLPSDVVSAIAEGAAGELWIGTRTGIARLQRGRVIPGPPELSNLDILTLYVDSAGALWIGSAGGGLARLRSGRLDIVTGEHGLADDVVYSVSEDGMGGLWLSGPRGVSRYDKAALERYMDTMPRSGRLRPRLYGPADGMRTRETNGGVFPAVWRAADGRLWYPTVRGVAVFDPRVAAARSPAPPIVVEWLAVNDSSVPVQNALQLPPGSSTLHFGFTALEFDQPERVRFRYQLQGFDTTWTDAGTNRDARYTNVPPGEYTFRVVAEATNGAWSGGATSFALTLEPHFYETVVFRGLAVLLAALALLAGAVGIHRRRLHKLVAREQELLALVADRSRAEERYRELFENATDAVFTTDLEGCITNGNRRFVELSGRTPEQLHGMPIDTLISDVEGDGHQAFRPWDEPKLAAPAELIRPDGSRAALEVSTRRVEIRGQVEGIQGIARDVTEQRAIEQRMIQAQRMEALGQFAGGVAHDFNNVLAAISAYCELLLADLPADAAARADVAEIQEAARRAAQLTRQLLAFSRQQVLQPQVLALNDAVTGVESMLRRLLREDIAMDIVLSPEAGEVVADHRQLEQVLLNLIVNARDAMPEGGRITVETGMAVIDDMMTAADRSPMLPGRYAMLSVRDSGCGIPAEAQVRMFEPFFTTKPVGSGTGLGLATVMGIVEQSGGHITCESALGVGTVFRIYLPAATAGAGELPATVRAAPAAAAAGARNAGTETILVVEDDASVRRTTCRILAGRGYTVVEARDGVEAIEYCSPPAARVDVVLSDMIMPRMNGHELAAQLRSRMPRLRVLLMSGYTKDAAIRQDLVDGVDGFIEKPFTADVLAATVRAVLDGPRAVSVFPSGAGPTDP